VLGKQEQAYANLFAKQVARIKERMSVFPLDDPDYLWIFDLYYQRTSADVSPELIFDLMQEHGLITNDNNIRSYMCRGHIDREVPRAIISIFTQQKEH
jgi:hypothetical protein